MRRPLNSPLSTTTRNVMISCYHLSAPNTRKPGSPLFDNISFEIPDGSWAEITGPSGCGKSLLFAVMSLQLAPTQGTLIVQGRNLPRCTPSRIAELRRSLGICAQQPSLLDDRTTFENLLVPFVAREQLHHAPELVHAALQRAELSHLADLPARSLTLPERRLVTILRACLGDPAAILIDGGLDHLDEPSRRRAQQLLRAQHRQGATIFLFHSAWTSSTTGRSVELRISTPNLEVVERSALHAPSPEATARGPRR
jgi:ABC-type lipoprotein export system ATPase subunit